MRLVSEKNSSVAEITSQRALTPAPCVYASSETSSSATPPPRAVELTFHTTRPANRSRARCMASITVSYRSAGRIDWNRSRLSRPTGTVVRAGT